MPTPTIHFGVEGWTPKPSHILYSPPVLSYIVTRAHFDFRWKSYSSYFTAFESILDIIRTTVYGTHFGEDFMCPFEVGAPRSLRNCLPLILSPLVHVIYTSWRCAVVLWFSNGGVDYCRRPCSVPECFL